MGLLTARDLGGIRVPYCHTLRSFVTPLPRNLIAGERCVDLLFNVRRLVRLIERYEVLRTRKRDREAVERG